LFIHRVERVSILDIRNVLCLEDLRLRFHGERSVRKLLWKNWLRWSFCARWKVGSLWHSFFIKPGCIIVFRRGKLL